VTYIPPEKWPGLFAAAERAAIQQVADPKAAGFTNDAFDHWISSHGLPATANEVRLMLEYAALIGMFVTKLDLE